MALTCKDVMVTPELQPRIHPDANVATALDMMHSSRKRFLPVVDESGKYLGVFTAPTLLKLILPRAATINLGIEDTAGQISNLRFMPLERADFAAQIERLRDERVGDNLSNPKNIPVAAPDTPVLEGILMIHRFKRHLILVEPETGQFVGVVSANSVLDHVLPDDDMDETDE